MKFAYASGTRPLDGFTIKRGVGIGGFGEVYFATSDAGKEVALKRIQRNLDVELRGVRQCLNLKHLNLISLYDIRYDDEGGAWVVMEFVAGESLKDVIERNPNGMPADEVDAWFRGIAAGVAYLHDHGIVHRDLKPGNIFDDGGVVKIGDYGLSKFISCSRRSGQTESVGTFHYMAPEIGKGVYGKEIDVYALGIILFEMLTGRVPFEGESSQEIIMKHLTADPDLTGVPDRYRPAIERSLRKDPDQRFADVESLLRCFELGEPLEPDPIVEVLAEEVPVATAQPVPAAPPVIRPASAAREHQGTLYISDEEPAAEIVFGPVQQRAGNLPPRTPQPPVPMQPPQPPHTSLQSTPAVAPEPVAQAVRQGVHSGARWWRDARLSTPLKVLVAFAAVFVVLLNANWLLPLAVFAGAVYLVYFGVRSLILALNGTSQAGAAAGVATAGSAAASVATRPAAHGPAAAPGAGNAPRYRLVGLDHRVRQVLRQKPARDRVSELLGSLLMSALVSAVLCVVLMVLGGRSLDGTIDSWSFYAWMVLSSVAGAWLILGLGKLWEDQTADSVLRRFAMLVGGLAVGAGAFAASQVLLVEMSDAPSVSLPVSLRLPNHLTETLYAADGSPLLGAYVVYFGGLFLILRWWRQVDPLRKTRLSLWATAACALWAWILTMFWQFPQPWGFMLAMTISIAVQLASPWIGGEERERLGQRYREA